MQASETEWSTTKRVFDSSYVGNFMEYWWEDSGNNCATWWKSTCGSQPFLFPRLGYWKGLLGANKINRNSDTNFYFQLYLFELTKLEDVQIFLKRHLHFVSLIFYVALNNVLITVFLNSSSKKAVLERFCFYIPQLWLEHQLSMKLTTYFKELIPLCHSHMTSSSRVNGGVRTHCDNNSMIITQRCWHKIWWKDGVVESKSRRICMMSFVNVPFSKQSVI